MARLSTAWEDEKRSAESRLVRQAWRSVTPVPAFHLQLSALMYLLTDSATTLLVGERTKRAISFTSG